MSAHVGGHDQKLLTVAKSRRMHPARGTVEFSLVIQLTHQAQYLGRCHLHSRLYLACLGGQVGKGGAPPTARGEHAPGGQLHIVGQTHLDHLLLFADPQQGHVIQVVNDPLQVEKT